MWADQNGMEDLTQQIKMGWAGGEWEDEDLRTRYQKPIDGVLCKKYFDHQGSSS